jgi:hypothetical protein
VRRAVQGARNDTASNMPWAVAGLSYPAGPRQIPNRCRRPEGAKECCEPVPDLADADVARAAV